MARDLGDHLLVAAHRPLALGDGLDPPALEGGVALVHAVEVSGEERGLVAAGAGADFEDDAASSAASLGRSAIRKPCSSRAIFSASAGVSASARARISASVAGSARRPARSACSDSAARRSAIAETSGASSACSRDSLTISSGGGPAFRRASTSAARRVIRSSLSAGSFTGDASHSCCGRPYDGKRGAPKGAGRGLQTGVAQVMSFVILVS